MIVKDSCSATSPGTFEPQKLVQTLSTCSYFTLYI